MGKYFVFFVEGVDDKRFFETIIQPMFEQKEYRVTVWDYQNEQPRRMRNFLRTLSRMGGCYLFTTDINDSPCITHKKQKVRRRWSQIDPARILVIIKEIESWYLAVLEENQCPSPLRRCCVSNTDGIDKETFRSMRPRKFDLDTDFKVEILKYYSVDKAIQRNASFRYFYNKHCC